MNIISLAGLMRHDDTLIVVRKEDIETLLENFRYINTTFGDMQAAIAATDTDSPDQVESLLEELDEMDCRADIRQTSILIGNWEESLEKM